MILIRKNQALHHKDSHLNSIDPIVLLCRDLKLTKKDVSEELMVSFSGAMQEGCPQNYHEAKNSQESKYWIEAMEAEMKSIRDAETWKIESSIIAVKL